MSKSKGNVVNPWDHFNKEGADAIRWYMTTQSAPWSPMNFDPNGVRETYAKMFLTLWNVYRFHADYASLDNFNPDDEKGFIPVDQRSPLDRWILSRMASVAHAYHNQFESWEFHKAGRDLENFVINDLSNWYVRRSRRRLWDEADSTDKQACQHTLHEVLSIVTRLMAPIAPFMSDKIHNDLTGTSVHMADWPFDGNLSSQDLDLEQQMSVVRSLAETGRKIRVDVNRRQRLPCRSGWIVGGPELSDFYDILEEELNVEDLTTEPDLDRFQRIELAPNHKALGAKCRADLPKVLTELAKAEPETLLSEIGAGSAKLAGYDIGTDDVEVHRVEKDGFAASTFSVDDSGDVSLVLDVSIDDELLSKGLAREITRRVQSKRKDLDLDVEVTIDLTVWLTKGCPKLESKDWEYVKSETRANPAELSYSKPSGASDKFEVDGETLFFSLKQNN